MGCITTRAARSWCGRWWMGWDASPKRDSSDVRPLWPPHEISISPRTLSAAPQATNSATLS